MANLNIPCSTVILPTKAELSNLFIQMANSELEEVQDALDKIEDILGDFPLSIPKPLYEELDIPEIEWEKKVDAMIKEYHLYVGTKILEIIDKVISIDFEIEVIGGIKIDVLKLFTDPSYLQSIKKITCENLDTLYALVPDEYKTFDGRYGLDSKELQCDVVFSYIMSQVNKGILGLMTDAIDKVMEKFEDVLKELIDPIPTLSELSDPRELVRAIIEDEKMEIKEKLEKLEAIKIGEFSLLDAIGGKIEEELDIAERKMNRILDKLQDFLNEYATYLFKKFMEKLAKFLDAIGLGEIIDFLTFDFCDFLELIGMPKTIDISAEFTVAALSGSAVTPLPTISSVSFSRDGTLRYIATQGQTEFSGLDVNGNSGLNNIPSFVFVNGTKKIPGATEGSEVLYSNNTITIAAGTNEGDTILIID